MCLPQSLNLKSIPNSSVVSHKEGYILWHIHEDRLTADMDKMKVVMAFENGFKILEQHFHPIQFKSTSDKSQASILIGFYNNTSAGLPNKFSGNTLAYAYANYGESFQHSSDMFFNDHYRWAEMDKPGQEYNLKKVFVHEALHALGFEHSDFKEDILYWQYQTDDKIHFTEDTIKAIKDRYKSEMERIKKLPDVSEKSTIFDFCKDVINFKKYKNFIPSIVFANVLKHFGITPETNSMKIKDQLIKYLHG